MLKMSSFCVYVSPDALAPLDIG